MSKKCLRFHFFNSPGIGPWLIKARLGSRISHVGIEFEDKRYFHATFWHGMVEQPLSEIPYPPESTVEVYVTEEQYNAALKLCVKHVGAMYDYLAIIGFTLGRSLQNQKSLFCSEIGRQVFEVATDIKLRWNKLCAPHELKIMIDAYNQTKAQRDLS